MSANISVEPSGENEFRVTVSEGSTRSSHRVTVQPKDYERIAAGKIAPPELVKMSLSSCSSTSARNRPAASSTSWSSRATFPPSSGK